MEFLSLLSNDVSKTTTCKEGETLELVLPRMLEAQVDRIWLTNSFGQLQSVVTLHDIINCLMGISKRAAFESL